MILAANKPPLKNDFFELVAFLLPLKIYVDRDGLSAAALVPKSDSLVIGSIPE